MFTSTSSLSAVVAWCRTLRHGVEAGLSLVKIFRQLAKSGPMHLRTTAEVLAIRLQKGESLEDSLRLSADTLPPLFIDLVSLGETTGHLPEIFADLEDYYQQQLSAKRTFLQLMIWPLVQFIAAVLIIALLIVILGAIADTRGGKPIAPIGFGLTGVEGALIFLLAVGLLVGLAFVAWKVIPKMLSGGNGADGVLLKLPVIGPYRLAQALHRFSLGLKLTLGAGLKADQAVVISLRATGNTAFANHADRAKTMIRNGHGLIDTLMVNGPFPNEYLGALMVGESTGREPEVLDQQAQIYRDESSRRLKALTMVASFAVWGFVALMIIWAIFRIASVYLNAIDDALGGV